jgi:hypothetical protein
MATATDYGVTFGYKAQDGYWYGPNGRVGRYHRGNDRPTPTGIPIVIGNVTIGLTGATGLVSGPHLHTQAMIPGTNTDVDPAPYEFKYGTVVSAGWHSQFGNYVTMRVSGIDITYAHLSQINVTVGQEIGVSEMADRNQANAIYKAVLFRDGDEAGLQNYTGKDANFIIADMLNSQERRNLEAQFASLQGAVSDRDKLINQLNQTIQRMNEIEAAEDVVESEKAARLQSLQEHVRILETQIKRLESQPKPDPIITPTPQPEEPDELKKTNLLTVILKALFNKKK